MKLLRVKKWVSNIQAQLDIAYKVDFGYPVDSEDNYIKLATENDTSKIREYKNIPEDLLSFYSRCSMLNLSGIHNGYFIHSLPEIEEYKAHKTIPSKIVGRDMNSEVITFGADGGGGKFIYHLKSGNILYIPTFGAVENYEYHIKDDFNPICLVADTFFHYLEILLKDIEAFVAQEKGWIYIDECWK